VSPLEVDDVLRHHPAVEQVVTFAVPHDKLGEEIGDFLHRYLPGRHFGNGQKLVLQDAAALQLSAVFLGFKDSFFEAFLRAAARASL